MLEVDAGREADDGPLGEGFFDNASEFRLVGDPGGTASGGRAQVAIAAEIEARGASLSNALDLHAERRGFDLHVEDAADNDALGGPEMKEAAVVVAGDGELRVGQVEGNDSVFDNDGGASAFEEFGELAAERVGGHSVALTMAFTL